LTICYVFSYLLENGRIIDGIGRRPVVAVYRSRLALLRGSGVKRAARIEPAQAPASDRP